MRYGIAVAVAINSVAVTMIGAVANARPTCPACELVDGTLAQPEPLPVAEPIIALDDTRTHGPTARDWVDLWITGAWLQTPNAADTYALTGQLSVGVPSFHQQNAHDLLTPYEVYELRLRYNAFEQAGDWLFGPMTVAVQRYFPIAPLAIKPLVFAHFGVEFAVSTPWFSDRLAIPPVAVRILDAADTELAENGWSVRPAGYFRADFLACRSAYIELGGSPELFAPSSGSTEYDVRVHVAGGWSFGCTDGVSRYRPMLTMEYRDRFRLSSSTQPLEFEEITGAGFQINLGAFAAQAFVEINPSHISYQMYGLRLQLGAKRFMP